MTYYNEGHHLPIIDAFPVDVTSLHCSTEQLQFDIRKAAFRQQRQLSTTKVSHAVCAAATPGGSPGHQGSNWGPVMGIETGNETLLPYYSNLGRLNRKPVLQPSLK